MECRGTVCVKYALMLVASLLISWMLLFIHVNVTPHPIYLFLLNRDVGRNIINASSPLERPEALLHNANQQVIASSQTSFRKVTSQHRETTLPIQINVDQTHLNASFSAAYPAWFDQLSCPKSCASMPVNFVMALSYYDQQTSALRRLRSLQCWAHEVGDFGVVQPVVTETYLSAQLNKAQSNFTAELNTTHSQVLQLSDLYDIQYLSGEYLNTRFGPLVDWECIKCSPVKWEVILVNIVYTNMRRNINRSLLLRQNCSNLLQGIPSVVRREATVNLKEEGLMTSNRFSELVFGNLSYSNNVLVIFSEWRGIISKSYHHITVNDSKCQVGSFTRFIVDIPLSPWVIRDAQNYHHQFLGGKPYISLMIRAESKTCETISQFLEGVFDTWKSMRLANALSQTFVAVDAGQFGTKARGAVYNKRECNALLYIKDFFRRIYGNTFTFDEWEKSFVTVSGTTHPGYIAVLQKAITARAKCIALAGEGSFQTHAKNLYINRLQKAHNISKIKNVACIKLLS